MGLPDSHIRECFPYQPTASYFVTLRNSPHNVLSTTPSKRMTALKGAVENFDVMGLPRFELGSSGPKPERIAKLPHSPVVQKHTRLSS